MINFKKIVNFSMPKRKPKKQIPVQAQENHQNQNEIIQQDNTQNENQIKNPNKEEEDFWVDCNNK